MEGHSEAPYQTDRKTAGTRNMAGRQSLLESLSYELDRVGPVGMRSGNGAGKTTPKRSGMRQTHASGSYSRTVQLRATSNQNSLKLVVRAGKLGNDL